MCLFDDFVDLAVFPPLSPRSVNECGDNSDESLGVCRAYPPAPPCNVPLEFTCADKSCVLATAFCNG